MENIRSETSVLKVKQNKNIKNPENEILSIKNKEIPELKYEQICELIWKDPEFLKLITNSLNKNFSNLLKENWINFKNLFEIKTEQKLNVV